MRTLNTLWAVFEKILRAIVNLPFKIMGRELTDEKWNGFFQFIKFCFVGVSNTAISLITYYIFIAINKDWYILGNAVGFVVSVLNAYFWNSKFVFNKKNEVGKTVLKTFAAYGVLCYNAY